jgi:3-deoxy-D-manno-octulosonic-acid transferase
MNAGAVRASALLGLVRLTALLLTPLILAVLICRLLQGKEDPRRWGERLGFSLRGRPPGQLVWLHAASVGELISLVPLLQQLDGEQGPNLLLTTGSRSSAELASRCLGIGVVHQFVPLDHWLSFALFRRHWRPDLGVLAEAELWPELIHAMARPMLINARMSERSFRSHHRHPWFAAWLLGRFQVCLAQSRQDAERFLRLGARDVRVVGSTKRDADPPRVDAAIVSRLIDAFASRPVLLLASSHAGEEAELIAAYPHLRRRLPGLALLLVPRHPQRAHQVAAAAARDGLAVGCWSALGGVLPQESFDVVVADRIGEMGAWIQVCRLVVMGGSLGLGGRPVGGHNPLEPLRLGRPVLCGPDMANFADLTEELSDTGWLRQCADLDQLWQAVATHPAWDALPEGPPPELQGPTRLIAELIRTALIRVEPGS